MTKDEFLRSVSARMAAKVARTLYRQPSRRQLLLSTTFLTPLERI